MHPPTAAAAVKQAFFQAPNKMAFLAPFYFAADVLAVTRAYFAWRGLDEGPEASSESQELWYSLQRPLA